MTQAEEIRDSAILLEILDWIVAVRAVENHEFTINPIHRVGRDIVVPNWLFRLMLSDLEIYVVDKLKQRGIEPPDTAARVQTPG